MLDHLRKQVVETLAQVNQVTLATDGIAGLQTSILPCESTGLNLYLLAPQTSDHLANLEDTPECVVATEKWQLRGHARRVPLSDFPHLALARRPDADWSALIEIHPTRLQIEGQEGVGDAATIDIDESSLKGERT